MYIGKAANLATRIGGRSGSYLKRIQGLSDPDNRTNLCPAEKCAVADGKQLKFSFAVTYEEAQWESELLRNYVAYHGVKPGYRTLAGEWCRGNYQSPKALPPIDQPLNWSDFVEYGSDLILPDESGVYRVRIAKKPPGTGD